MVNDRSWMHHRLPSNGIGITQEYRLGVEEFLKYTAIRVMNSNNKIRYPCNTCKNLHWKIIDEVKFDLFRWGILESYKIWNLHGEVESENIGETSRSNNREPNDDIFDTLEMLRDACGQHVDNETTRVEEQPFGKASQFYKLIQDASVPIYPNNTKFTKLSFITKLLHFKSRSGCSENGFDELLALICEVLPVNHTLPDKYKDIKKMVQGLNLGYEKIDACKNDCMLFYGSDDDKQQCYICGSSRFEENSSNKKKIPKKILRYFPLTPRLQRLYMSSHTAEHMRWHKNRYTKPGMLTHPADGQEWKSFDLKFPSFAREIRNIRLGLATDGFSPFSNAFSKQYSVWPVIVVVYNLPPSMCMKDPYMFMTLLIPGEKSPTKDINVYLRPLIDELNMLWKKGVETYDKYSKTNFNMRAALLWTINDFPAYGMISGWSTHGRLACPVCLGDVKGFQLKNGGKCCFWGTARHFLKDNERFSGRYLKSFCKSLQFPPPGKAYSNERVEGYGKTHNWTHFSIFFDLPYWETLMLRHCIDVMHTEKNVFDNVFHTIIDDGKSKDNKNARKDLELLNIRKELWMKQDGFDEHEGDGHVMEHIKNTMRSALWEEKDRARKKATRKGTSLYDEMPCYFGEVVWRSFCDHWLGSDFQKLSAIGCANRKQLKVVHTSGAQSFAKVKMDLARKYGEAPSQIALFEVTHKSKESNDYISTYAKDIAERYQALKDKQDPSCEMSEQQRIEMWAEVTGPITRNRMIGLPGIPANMMLSPSTYAKRTSAYQGSQTGDGLPNFLFLKVVDNTIAKYKSDARFNTALPVTREELEVIAEEVLSSTGGFDPENRLQQMVYGESLRLIVNILEDLANDMRAAVKAGNVLISDSSSNVGDNDSPLSG